MPNVDVREQVAPFKSELKEFFSSRGHRTYILYRTCMKKFDRESPHNLLPQYKKDGVPYFRPEDQLRIYLEFEDEDISLDTITRIIAYPEENFRDLPLISNPRLGWPKADLARIPEKYLFRSIQDLRENYERILT